MTSVTGTSTGRRRALVTGASAGIGNVFARRLAAQGYDLTVVARDTARLESLAAELTAAHGIEVEVIAADLTDGAALARVETRLEAEPPIDLLVNNAGIGTMGPFAELDPAKEEAEIRLNVIALVRLTRATLGPMVARRSGRIIQVSSLAAFQPGPYNATYAATKAFVNSFSEAIHEELRGSGVGIQVLCPGFTRTEFQERAGASASRLPKFAWMEADEVVEASLKALRRGSLVCIPGITNKAMAFASRISPRPLVRRLSGRIGRDLRD